MEVVEEPVGEGCCQFMGGLDSEKHISLKPKDFFANERNFIHWMHMAATMGSVASLITTMAQGEDEGHRRATLLTSSVLLFTGVAFAIYSLALFFMRRQALTTRTGSVDEPWGPLILSTILGLSLTLILLIACLRVV
mmetsp:Transcript_50545/g.118976  ORF Transcript_50545/g.118976 Transcript_50545/m.118976 type:complete len:137 (-) Transcript_50545:29-439(-)